MTPTICAHQPQPADDLKERHRRLGEHGHRPPRPAAAAVPAASAPRTASSSSASGSPCAPRTAASRTACAQGAGSPAEARSATVRTACSTRWRAVSLLVRGARTSGPAGRGLAPVPGTSATAAARACRTRGSALRSQAAFGGLARPRWRPPRPRAGRRTPRAPARSARRAAAVAYTGRSRAAAASTSAEIRRAARPALGDEPAEHLAQFADALPGERGQREHGRRPGSPCSPSAMPSSSSSRRRSSRTWSAASPGQPVHLVEDDEGDLRVPGQRPQIALVQHGVRVLLRVDHPDHRVDERQHAGPPARGARTAAESWSGRSTRTSPRSAPAPSALCSGRAPQPARDAEPVEEARRAVGPAAGDGRGGGRPAYARSRRWRTPASALKSCRLAAAGGARRWRRRCAREESRCRAAASSSTRPASARVRCRAGSGRAPPARAARRAATRRAAGVRQGGHLRPAGREVAASVPSVRGHRAVRRRHWRRSPAPRRSARRPRRRRCRGPARRVGAAARRARSTRPLTRRPSARLGGPGRSGSLPVRGPGQ